MLRLMKQSAISILEGHPYGYAIGLAIMESSEFFLPHETDFYAMPLVAKNAESGLFLDIGANRGHSALGFKKLLPSWDVISIEANPLHRKRLEKLKARGKLTDFHIVAADYVSGTPLTIWTPSYYGVYCHSSSAVEYGEAVRSIELSFSRQAKNFKYVSDQTHTLALDELNLKPNIVKIDIQGKEIDCLRGLKKTIEQHRPVFLIECNLDGHNIISYMMQLKYKPYLYDRESHHLLEADETLELSNGRNVFFIPETI